jgi:hypothetical protein
MTACRTWVTAAALAILTASSAGAQNAPQQPAQDVWQQQQPARDPWSQGAAPIQQGPMQQAPMQRAPMQQASPWGGQPQEMPPCVKEFLGLRDNVEKYAKAVQGAQKRKAHIKEACSLLTSLLSAQQKMLKYTKEKGASCGVPQQINVQLAEAIKQVGPAREKVCEMAAQGPQPAGPSLSDALGASAIPDADNVKTGRGTFDTLTGTPLGR